MNDKKHHPFLRILNNRKGVSAILIAFMLPVLIGFAALAIDVGYMYATKNELQNIADGAALAGAGELGRIYLELDEAEHSSYVPGPADEVRIKSAAQDVAELNEAAGLTIMIDETDIFIGEWNFSSDSFQEGMEVPLDIESTPAVRVFARRDSSMLGAVAIGNGPVATFFARIFSIFGGSHDTFESSAVATAALSGLSISAEGVIKTPFAISENQGCEDGLVKFYPTPESCAGWHNFFDAANASTINAKFIGFIEGYKNIDGDLEGQTWIDTHYTGLSKTYSEETAPSVSIHDELEYSGGTISSLFSSGEYYEQWTGENTPIDISTNNPGNYPSLNPFKNLYDFFRFRDGDEVEPGENISFCGDPEEGVPPDEVWSSVIPIYKDNTDGSCSNPKGLIETVSFGLVKIRMVFDEDFPFDPAKADVYVCYECPASVAEGRGGGGTSGNVIGSIPNLVE